MPKKQDHDVVGKCYKGTWIHVPCMLTRYIQAPSTHKPGTHVGYTYTYVLSTCIPWVHMLSTHMLGTCTYVLSTYIPWIHMLSTHMLGTHIYLVHTCWIHMLHILYWVHVHSCIYTYTEDMHDLDTHIYWIY